MVSFQYINSNSFKAAWIFGCMLDWTREYWLHACRMCLLIDCRNLPGNCSKSFKINFAFAVAPFPTGHCQDWHSESRASYGIKIKDKEAWNLARSYVVARAVLLVMIPFSACSDVLKVLKNLCTKLITKLIWIYRFCTHLWGPKEAGSLYLRWAWMAGRDAYIKEPGTGAPFASNETHGQGV